MEGDLVFPKDSATAVLDDNNNNDDGDEPLTNPGEEDAGADAAGEGEGEGEPEAKRAKTFGAPVPPVHVVTKEDVEQGTFQLTDVVLPMPG